MILIGISLICALLGCGVKQQEDSLSETEQVAATNSQMDIAKKESAEIVAASEVLKESETAEIIEDTEMKLYFDAREIPVIWENCTAVDELNEEAGNSDIVVSMSMYGGWEQVGSLGRSYTRSDRQMTAVSGDIVLYSGNQIVVFYGSNSWSYTKLGRMDMPQEKLEELLSNGDITLTIRK